MIDDCRNMLGQDARAQAQSVREDWARLAAGWPGEWPSVPAMIPQHGDFFLNNLMSHRNQWRIVDWESYRMIDLPFYDLLTFVISVLRNVGELPESWRPFLPLALANWFHPRWVDGWRECTAKVYKTIQHSFEHEDFGEVAFLRR